MAIMQRYHLLPMPEFLRFDPTHCHFPRPRVPVLPTLRWCDFTLGTDDVTPIEALTGPSVRHFARGRYAMHAAYAAAGVGPVGSLLAPAYHCRTMLDPALALGAEVLLYALNSDLTPKLDSINALVTKRKPEVKALVVTHYFGIEQPRALMKKMAQLCEQQCITLVEDCSHAWPIAVLRASTVRATTHHVVIASPYKFFAFQDGGTLWGPAAMLAGINPTSPKWVAELKALRHAVSRAWANSRPMESIISAGPGHCDDALASQDLRETSNRPSAFYEDRYENMSSLAISRWAVRHTRVSLVARQRQQNYRQWAQAVASLRHCKALFPELPPTSVPYMFALQIEDPEQHFHQLKRLGLPMWRWDEMAVSDCPVSARYRLHLLHLPCHQSLTREQMQWMTTAAAKVLA